MNKESELRGLLGDLWRQNPQGVTTWGDCVNAAECGNSARGGRSCVRCITKQIHSMFNRSTERDMVESYVSCIRQIRHLESALVAYL